jgi:CelD/BcsL family acetyltransferase involved in cellulose biosynthesis
VISALRSDYDPAYENLSPGTYMNWKMLEQLFNEDYRYYSMGPGGNTYKFRWAEELPDQYRMTLYNRTWRGRLLDLLELKSRPMKRTIVEFLKNAKDKVRG